MSIETNQEIIDNQLEIINLHNFVEKHQTTDDRGDGDIEDNAQEGIVCDVPEFLFLDSVRYNKPRI